MVARSASRRCCTPGASAACLIFTFTSWQLAAARRWTETRWCSIGPDDEAFSRPRLAEFFKNLFLAELRKCFAKAQITMPPSMASIVTPHDFDTWLVPIEAKDWMVDCQGPPVEAFDSRAALRYASQYVAGVAFGDRRILSAADDEIEFYVWDYRTESETSMTLHPHEFIRRFAWHILPPNVNRNRDAGIYHGRNRSEKLALCRKLLAEQARLERTPIAADLVAGTEPVIATTAAELAASAPPTLDGLGREVLDPEPTSEELAEARAELRELERQKCDDARLAQRLDEMAAARSKKRLEDAITDALNPNRALEHALGRIDAELKGEGATYLAPREPIVPMCRRCLMPRMIDLGVFYGRAAQGMMTELVMASKRLSAATTQRVVWAACLAVLDPVVLATLSIPTLILDTAQLASSSHSRSRSRSNHVALVPDVSHSTLVVAGAVLIPCGSQILGYAEYDDRWIDRANTLRLPRPDT